MERGLSLVNVIWESPLFYCGRWSDSLNILKKERIKMRRNLNKIRFILCESCFWCASCLNLGVKVDRCPICDICKVESMQVSDNELYKSNRNPIKSRSTANFKLRWLNKIRIERRKYIYLSKMTTRYSLETTPLGIST